jgi:hypothetical protein
MIKKKKKYKQINLGGLDQNPSGSIRANNCLVKNLTWAQENKVKVDSIIRAY